MPTSAGKITLDWVGFCDARSGTGRPSPFDGAGRPGGPALADRYAGLLTPATAALDGVERFERALREGAQLTIELAAAFERLDTALQAADHEDSEIMDPGRIEQLTILRRQLEGARREHTALLTDLDDARPLRRAFIAKAERVREAAISVLFEQLVTDRRAALDRLRQHWLALHGGGDEETALARALAARWEARTGQPVRVPTIVWPKKTGDPFAGPTLEGAEG